MASGLLLAMVAMLIIVVLTGITVFYLIARMAGRVAGGTDKFLFARPPDGNEYRGVIIKAYERLEANLGRYGIPRHGCETVRQHIVRAADQLALEDKGLRELLDSFEQARYSNHSCGEPERGRAINSLRAVQYELEKIVLTQEQLAMLAKLYETGGDAREPKPATPERMGLWVVPPSVTGSVNLPRDRGGKYRDLVPARDSGKQELVRKYGTPNLKADDRLPKEEVEKLSSLASGKLYTGLGTRLLELAGGPANSWRVFVEPTLVSYLLEFVARLAEDGRAGRPPTLDDSKVVLLAATVLAVADGRVFLVPDDIKLALVAAGPFVYHIDTSDAGRILHEEIRQVPIPQGLGFMIPGPARVRGLTVPAG